jgi:hypothetical protein
MTALGSEGPGTAAASTFSAVVPKLHRIARIVATTVTSSDLPGLSVIRHGNYL